MQVQRKERPPFAHWRYDHGLTVRATADRLQQIAGHRIVSHEKVRTLCLPFDDPERTEPDNELMEAISTLTGGEIDGASFRAPAAQAA